MGSDFDIHKIFANITTYADEDDITSDINPLSSEGNDVTSACSQHPFSDRTHTHSCILSLKPHAQLFETQNKQRQLVGRLVVMVLTEVGRF